jgi:hypothetical protein
MELLLLLLAMLCKLTMSNVVVLCLPKKKIEENALVFAYTAAPKNIYSLLALPNLRTREKAKLGLNGRKPERSLKVPYKICRWSK